MENRKVTSRLELLESRKNEAKLQIFESSAYKTENEAFKAYLKGRKEYKLPPKLENNVPLPKCLNKQGISKHSSRLTKLGQPFVLH